MNGQLMLPAPFLTDCLGLRVEALSGETAWRISGFGRQLKIKRGSPRCTVDITPLECAGVPQVIGGCVHVPADMIARAFGITPDPATGGNGYELRSPGAAVLDVRGGRYGSAFRLVIDLSGPAPYWLQSETGELVVEIAPPCPVPAGWGALRLFSFDDPIAVTVRARVGPANWTRLVITHGRKVKPTVFSLGEPCRIVVDIPLDNESYTPALPSEVIPEPAPPPVPIIPPVATPWDVRSFNTPRGPVRVFALKCTPTAVRPALAASTIRQRARVSIIAAREGATAGVNGGYFDWSGPPLGMLVIDGEWIKHPILNRCALGITQDGRALMGRVRFAGAARIEGVGKLILAGLNTGHTTLDSTILYTRRWGPELAGSPTKVRAVIDGNARICRLETEGRAVAIPADGYVLSAGGEAGQRLRRAVVGAQVATDLGTDPPWPPLRHALGAGPQLVRNGVCAVTAREEQFRDDVCRVSPRAAVGIARDGNLIIAAADGDVSKGVSLWETADIMRSLGCREAMALDGGGSTTVVAGGRVINHPTDGVSRAVSNALLVFGQTLVP